MWEGMPYMRQHLLRYVTWASTSVRVFAQPVNHLSHVSYAFMLSYWETANTVKRWELTSAPQLQLTLFLLSPKIYIQTQRLALHTNIQTHPVARSHFGPLCCPSQRQWWLFSKLTPPTKACDHLSCQQASAETTNQPTVILALKISPQKNVSPTCVQNSAAHFPILFLLIFMQQTLSGKPRGMSVTQRFCMYNTMIWCMEVSEKPISTCIVWNTNCTWQKPNIFLNKKNNDDHLLIPL